MVKYRLLGSASTNSNGVTVLDGGYTGIGNGEMDFIASTTNPIGTGINSNIKEVEDCLWHDSIEDNSNLNPYRVNCNPNIELSSEWSSTGSKSIHYTFDSTTQQSNARYFGIDVYNNSAYGDINDFIGERVRFSFDYNLVSNPTGTVYSAIFVRTESNTSWSTATSQVVSLGEGTATVQYDCPLDLTHIWLRFNCGTTVTSTDCYVDNWKIIKV